MYGSQRSQAAQVGTCAKAEERAKSSSENEAIGDDIEPVKWFNERLDGLQRITCHDKVTQYAGQLWVFILAVCW